MIEIQLAKLPKGRIATAESVERFTVTGPMVYNRSYAHKIVAFDGPCCELSIEHLHLSAVATVIASEPIEAPRAQLTIAVNERIRINGKAYEVIARRGGDPILTRVKRWS